MPCVYLVGMRISAAEQQALGDFLTHLPVEIPMLALLLFPRDHTGNLKELQDWLPTLSNWPVHILQGRMQIKARQIYVFTPDSSVSGNASQRDIPHCWGAQPNELRPLWIDLSETGQGPPGDLRWFSHPNTWHLALPPARTPVTHRLPAYQMGSKIQELIYTAQIQSLEGQLERERANGHLAEADHHRLSLVAEQIPNLVVITDAAFQIEFANQAYLNRTGYRREELQGQTPLFLQGEATDPLTLTRIVKALVHKREVREEILLYTRDAEAFWCELVITPVAAQANQSACYIVLQNDITQRKQREELLLFQADILAHVNDAIMVFDLSGKISYWNKGAERTFGYRLEALIDQPVQHIHPDLDIPDFLARYAQTEAGAQSAEEVQRQHKDGHTIWVSLRLDVIYSPEGLPVGVIGVCRDITQRKETERHLQQHEQLYRSIAENFPQGLVMVLNHQLRCLYVEGQEMSSLLRRPQGIDYLADFPSPAREVLLAHFKQGLGGEQQGFELQLQEEWYAFRIVPLKEDAPQTALPVQVSRLLVVIQNISADKHALDEKSRLIQELIAKNEDLNQFTYIISHNLRAPIANLKGLFNLMELDDINQNSARALFGPFQQTVNKLDETILDLNRILSIRRYRNEISQTIDLPKELAWTLEHLASLTPSLPEWVVVDFGVTLCFSVKSYIQSILYNLISNAVKYRHPERTPEIRISSGRTGEHLWIEVKDNGLGLDLAQVQHKIFRLYMRFHPHIEGKGLGLYLIKTQAEALGGGVEMSSELGKGSCFRIYFKESAPMELPTCSNR